MSDAASSSVKHVRRERPPGSRMSKLNWTIGASERFSRIRTWGRSFFEITSIRISSAPVRRAYHSLLNNHVPVTANPIHARQSETLRGHGASNAPAYPYLRGGSLAHCGARSHPQVEIIDAEIASFGRLRPRTAWTWKPKSMNPFCQNPLDSDSRLAPPDRERPAQ